jgi:putative colanic acid biosynthesis acetyltransferase WcaF
MPIKLRNYQASFDRGANPFKEMLWLVTKTFFFRFPIPLPSAFRCFMLRIFGANIGVGVVIRAGVDITFPWRLTIGDFSWIGEEVKILNLNEVIIGSNCCVSQRAFLCTGSHNFKSEGFDLITEKITIFDSSWIAAQAFVGPGVSIGPDAMIAAGSMIARNVEANQIAIGNPARVVNLGSGKNVSKQ